MELGSVIYFGLIRKKSVSSLVSKLSVIEVLRRENNYLKNML